MLQGYCRDPTTNHILSNKHEIDISKVILTLQGYFSH